MRTGILFLSVGGTAWADRLLGLEPVFGVELDPRRCEVARHHHPGMEVVCGDARTVDYRRWRGRVDCLHASIPCPQWSKARRGVGVCEDHTDTVIRALDQLRCEWVFIECVWPYYQEHARMRKLMRGIGYTYSRPLPLDASDVGAPIPRPRYWAAGRADHEGQPMLPQYAEVAELPTPDPSPWELADPSSLQVADGVADRWEMECAGDGVVPLQTAVAMILLGLPVTKNLTGNGRLGDDYQESHSGTKDFTASAPKAGG